jgi:chemosensory pili system protein ChpA (sensor histidine kinase/response regulator)
MQQLRQMLQMFKQIETPESRQQLQECCQKLVRLGEKLNLPGWCALCQTALGAITNQENSYRTLAPIIIKEIKQSQELVLAGRGAEIKTSQQLQALSGTYLPSRSLQKS